MQALELPQQHLDPSQKEDYLGDDFNSPPEMLVVCHTGIRDLDGFTKLCN